jgi:hypothetical protein
MVFVNYSALLIKLESRSRFSFFFVAYMRVNACRFPNSLIFNISSSSFMINTTRSKLELYLLYSVTKNIGAWLNDYDTPQFYSLKANFLRSLYARVCTNHELSVIRHVTVLVRFSTSSNYVVQMSL